MYEALLAGLLDVLIPLLAGRTSDELFSLKSQLGALNYMKKCREDELKLIEARLSEVTQRIGELENVRGVANRANTQAIEES